MPEVRLRNKFVFSQEFRENCVRFSSPIAIPKWAAVALTWIIHGRAITAHSTPY